MSEWDDPTRGFDESGNDRGWVAPGSGSHDVPGSGAGVPAGAHPGHSAATPNPGPTAGHSPVSAPYHRVGPGGMPELWPGPIPLRPLGFGEIIETAFRVLRFNPRTIFGITFVVMAIATALGLLLSFGVLALVSGPAGMFEFSPDGQLPGESALNLNSGIVGLISFFLSGLLVVPVAEAALGRRINAGQSWTRIRGRILPLLGYLVISTLIGLALAALLAVVIFGAVTTDNGMLIGLTVFLGILLFLAAYLYVMVHLSLAPCVIVLEHAGPVVAIRRSFRLVKGAFWRTLGLLFVVSLITGIITGVLVGVLAIIGVVVMALALGGGASGAAAGVVAVVFVVLFAIAMVLVYTIVQPLSSATNALIYMDRRFRTEALAVELLAEAERRRSQPMS